MNEKKLVSAKRFAEESGMSVSTVRRWLLRGDLPPRTIGVSPSGRGGYWVREELEAWLRRRGGLPHER